MVKIGFWGLLQLAFIVLKLCGVVKWSWFVVFIPIWCGITFWIVALLVVVLIATISTLRGRKK